MGDVIPLSPVANGLDPWLAARDVESSLGSQCVSSTAEIGELSGASLNRDPLNAYTGTAPGPSQFESRRARREAERQFVADELMREGERGANRQANPTAEHTAEQAVATLAERGVATLARREPGLEAGLPVFQHPELSTRRAAHRRLEGPNNRPRVTLRRAAREVPQAMISLGAFVAVGLLAVGMTTPAEAFREPSLSEFESSSTPLVALTPAIAQKVKVDAAVATAASDDKAGRDSYTGMSYAENQRAVYQALGQGFAPGFIPTTGAIRWPFLKSVPMSSGYGEVRGDGIHNGTDFNPGVGAEIGAIADGVVTWVGWKPGWGYGYFVTIEHNVDGVKVESLYGHMIDQSSQLYPGQSVTVGQIVGLTGDTGYSFGPHLHLEIRIAGERTDPYTWLTEHATNG